MVLVLVTVYDADTSLEKKNGRKEEKKRKEPKEKNKKKRRLREEKSLYSRTTPLQKNSLFNLAERAYYTDNRLIIYK